MAVNVNVLLDAFALRLFCISAAFSFLNVTPQIRQQPVYFQPVSRTPAQTIQFPFLTSEEKFFPKRFLFGIQVLVEQSSSTSLNSIVAAFVRRFFGALGSEPQIINNCRSLVTNIDWKHSSGKISDCSSKRNGKRDVCLQHVKLTCKLFLTGRERGDEKRNASKRTRLMNDRFFKTFSMNDFVLKISYRITAAREMSSDVFCEPGNVSQSSTTWHWFDTWLLLWPVSHFIMRVNHNTTSEILHRLWNQTAPWQARYSRGSRHPCSPPPTKIQLKTLDYTLSTQC